MNLRVISYTALALLAAQQAHADVYYNSIVPNVGGHDGLADGANFMAQSFFFPSSPSAATLNLVLQAPKGPNDQGSAKIMLVPDDGTGGANGHAGSPQFSAPPFSFSHAQIISTVSDNTLSTTTPTTYSYSITSAEFSAVTPFTHNNEYWIALIPSVGSTAEWVFNDASQLGVGYENQNSFVWTTTANLFPDLPLTPGFGPYEMSIVPEPVSLAIMGVGLAGLGYARRRGRKS